MTCRQCSTLNVVCNKKPDPKTAPVARRPRVFLSRHALTLATWLLSLPHLPPFTATAVACASAVAAAAAGGSCSDFLEPLARTRSHTRAATLHLNSGTNLQLIYVNRQRVWVSNQRAAGSAAPAAAELLSCCCSSASSGVVYCAVIRPRLQKCNSFSCSKNFSLWMKLPTRSAPKK